MHFVQEIPRSGDLGPLLAAFGPLSWNLGRAPRTNSQCGFSITRRINEKTELRPFCSSCKKFQGLGTSGLSSGLSGLSPGPATSVFLRKRKKSMLELGPLSGLSLTLSRFVGRTGRRGPKSGSDRFFIITELEPGSGLSPKRSFCLK